MPKAHFLSILVAAAGASVGARPHAASAPIPTTVDSSCVAALDSLRVVFQRDYPGYRDKVTGHQAALAALTDSVRAVARTSDKHEVCIPALKRWARFFRDGHVAGPWQAGPPAPPPAPSASAAAPTGPPADDPARPSLRALDDSTVLVRLPTFEGEYKPAIDSFFGANSARLRTTPYLIVDVRGNGGGYTGSYDSLTPLLYTNPVHSEGADVWASARNIAYYRSLADTNFLSPKDQEQMRVVLARMESHVDQFVEKASDSVMRRDTVYPLPRAVAVLVDSVCASSCEDFLLEARQSAKVTVLGVTNTAGVHDYGEIHGVWLPGWRRVSLPTTRTRGPRIDNVGLAPGVRIPRTEPDAVEFARRYLRRPRP
ncbi:MAG TPA: S41 family peptidase [Gemmatimonadales bacterium]|nr:S41 family peptidase [Gemmatimonadales bacterium]